MAAVQHLVDDLYESDPKSILDSAQRYLSDRKFFRKQEEFRIETGFEEAPAIVISSSKPPSDGLKQQLERVIAQFRVLRDLPPGWNSYNGSKVNRAAVPNALELALDGIHRCEEPRIEANSEGGIDLLWEGGSREMTMSVMDDGQIEIFLAVDGQEPEEPDELVGLTVARQFFERYCSHA